MQKDGEALSVTNHARTVTMVTTVRILANVETVRHVITSPATVRVLLAGLEKTALNVATSGRGERTAQTVAIVPTVQSAIM